MTARKSNETKHPSNKSLPAVFCLNIIISPIKASNYYWTIWQQSLFSKPIIFFFGNSPKNIFIEQYYVRQQWSKTTNTFLYSIYRRLTGGQPLNTTIHINYWEIGNIGFFFKYLFSIRIYQCSPPLFLFRLVYLVAPIEKYICHQKFCQLVVGWVT